MNLKKVFVTMNRKPLFASFFLLTRYYWEKSQGKNSINSVSNIFHFEVFRYL